MKRFSFGLKRLGLAAVLGVGCFFGAGAVAHAYTDGLTQQDLQPTGSTALQTRDPQAASTPSLQTSGNFQFTSRPGRLKVVQNTQPYTLQDDVKAQQQNANNLLPDELQDKYTEQGEKEKSSAGTFFKVFLIGGAVLISLLSLAVLLKHARSNSNPFV